MRFFALGVLLLFHCSFGTKKSFSEPAHLYLMSVAPSYAIMDSTLCDGFDFPVGDKNAGGTYADKEGKKYTGWKITTQDIGKAELFSGENWNGSGGNDTDLGQPVYSIASGKVIFAGECPSILGKIILLEHQFAENGKVITVFSQYGCLDEIKIKKGELIDRRQLIGAIGKGKNNP